MEPVLITTCIKVALMKEFDYNLLKVFNRRRLMGANTKNSSDKKSDIYLSENGTAIISRNILDDEDVKSSIKKLGKSKIVRQIRDRKAQLNNS